MSALRPRATMTPPGADLPFSLRFFRALASPARAGILRALAQRAHTPAELSRRLGMGDSTVRGHLAVLRDAGLVVRREDGRVWAYHELTEEGRRVLATGRTGSLVTGLAGLAAVAGAAWAGIAWRARLPPPLPPGSMPMPLPPDPTADALARLAFALGFLALALLLGAGLLGWRARKARGQAEAG